MKKDAVQLFILALLCAFIYLVQRELRASGQEPALLPEASIQEQIPPPGIGEAYLIVPRNEVALKARVVGEILPPRGFTRASPTPNSFPEWLRKLPIKQGNPPVRLFDGREKFNQSAHAAVIDLDVGSKDLQQCADAVIRLRAEFLYSSNRVAEIAFNFTSGDRADYSRWIEGFRPSIDGNEVSWSRSAERDDSYVAFRKYLETVFIYAGSYSLSKEMTPVRDLESSKIGDVFIQGGFPGHAAIIVDLAVNPETGERAFLLAQSFMPAQDIHILKNPGDRQFDPWYRLGGPGELPTPEWTFQWSDLRSFR